MKKQSLFFLLLIVTSVLNAQLKVNSLGFIEIGTSPTSSYNLNLKGTSYFEGSTYLNGFTGIGIEPSTTDKLKVSGSCLLDGYVKIGNLPSTSDKLKVSGNSYFDGYVGIGVTPTTNYRLNINGKSHFGGDSEFYGTNTFYNSQMKLYGPQYGFTFYMEANNYYPGMYLSTGSSFNCDYVLVVDGDSYTYGQWISSDMQYKKNISTLDGKQILSKITNIDGKKYSFKSNEELDPLYKNLTSKENEYSNKPKNLPKGERYGLIAQEIEKEFPELVKTDSLTNLKAIDYDGMIPILLQSIKEQQKMIIDLQNQINKLK